MEPQDVGLVGGNRTGGNRHNLRTPFVDSTEHNRNTDARPERLCCHRPDGEESKESLQSEVLNPKGEGRTKHLSRSFLFEDKLC